MEEAQAILQQAKALKLRDLDAAVDLFASALKACVECCGELEAPAAEFYLEYGTALFELVQSTSGVLGKPVPETTDVAPQADGGKAVIQEPKQVVKPIGVDEMEAADTGKNAEQPEGVEEEGDDEDEGEDGDEDPDAQQDAEDLQVAWENVDVARTIYEKQDIAQVASQLADAYMTLGDIHSEKDDFDRAAQDYQSCIDSLQQLSPAAPRRLAEVHFKLCKALEGLDQLPEALLHCSKACEFIAARQAELEANLEAAISAAGDAPKDATAADEEAAIKHELLRLQDVMKDLKGQQDDLRDLMHNRDVVKRALMSAMTYAAGGNAGGSGSGSAAAARAAADPSSTVAASDTAPKPAVQELGVVGRGKSRITLAPVGSNLNNHHPPQNSIDAGKPAAPAAAAPDAGQPVKRKRNLEDLMSGADVLQAQPATDAATDGAKQPKTQP